MQHLAFYDMDRTITVHPTYSRFLVWMAVRRAPWRLLLVPLVALAGLGYGLGLVGRSRLKEINQRLLMGARARYRDLAPLLERHADYVIAGNIRQGALDRIAADRAAGYRIVIVTASYRLYVDGIADRLGIDDVIATDLLIEQGRVRPHILGENCYGPAKTGMIARWLAEQGLERSDCHLRCYSDHVSDVPLLDLADEAFATNAHAALRDLAGRRGWAVLDWPG